MRVKDKFAEIVRNAFAKDDKTITKPFIDAYNKTHDIENIYDINEVGRYGLQGFVNEEGVNIEDLNYMFELYTQDNAYHYYVYNGDGFPVVLQDVIKTYIDRVFETKDAINYCVSTFMQSALIMNTTQSHNPQLVDKINKLWLNGDTNLWKHILYALAVRDRYELIDKGIFVKTPQDAYDMAEPILMCVCDDQDLQMIINYIRN